MNMSNQSIYFIVSFLIIHLVLFSYATNGCHSKFSTLATFILSSVVSWIISNRIYNLMNKDRVNTKNRAILITGCDSGFGNSLAKECDKLGFNVFAGVLFPDGNGAKDLREKCSERLKIVKMDVTSYEDVVKVVELIKDSGLELWAVVNNAGVGHFAPLELGHDVKLLTQTLDVNVVGMVRVIKLCLPLLRLSRGRIINLSSMYSRFTMAGVIPYCMSKHAVRSLCDGLRKEVEEFGIKVIAIEPVLYYTPICDKQTQAKTLDMLWNETPKDVQAIFGNNFKENYIKYLGKLLKFGRKQTSEVVNAVINGVVLKDPNNTYKCGGTLDFFLTYPLSYLPERAQNCVIKLIDYL